MNEVPMLEEMAAFFARRLEGYDAHMLRDIAGAKEFYPYTASLLPGGPCRVLDLGCGTGLELEACFARNPRAEVTGIDLSREMLDALAAKFPAQRLHLVCGSYFDVPLGENVYDAAVSVESLHHFTEEQKRGLYRRLHAALKEGGRFILTDYFAEDDEQERTFFAEFARLRQAQGLDDAVFYHYDTPLTVDHEIRVLREAGFSRVTPMKHWGATWTVRAEK